MGRVLVSVAHEALRCTQETRRSSRQDFRRHEPMRRRAPAPSPRSLSFVQPAGRARDPRVQIVGWSHPFAVPGSVTTAAAKARTVRGADPSATRGTSSCSSRASGASVASGRAVPPARHGPSTSPVRARHPRPRRGQAALRSSGAGVRRVVLVPPPSRERVLPVLVGRALAKEREAEDVEFDDRVRAYRRRVTRQVHDVGAERCL